MRIIIFIALIFLLSVNTSIQAQASKTAELKPVSKVDLDRYLGTWYEIAKYPNRFQRQCVGETTANYKLKPNGRIEVLNTCKRSDGTVESAVGEAKIADKKSNSRLKVRFAPGFVSWLPFVWANYWIIDLDPNYEYALIGEPKREYFWILSRRPNIGDAKYQELLEKAKTLGFDPSKIVKTPQTKS